MTKTILVTEFLGDGISVELSRSLHQVAAALPVDIQFVPIDLTCVGVVDELDVRREGLSFQIEPGWQRYA